MNEQQQPTVKGKFYTLAGIKDGSIVGNADHISRIQLNVSTKKGSKCSLSFDRNPNKAIRFDDLEGTEVALKALSMFMGSRVPYVAIEHEEWEPAAKVEADFRRCEHGVERVKGCAQCYPHIHGAQKRKR